MRWKLAGLLILLIGGAVLGSGCTGVNVPGVGKGQMSITIDAKSIGGIQVLSVGIDKNATAFGSSNLVPIRITLKVPSALINAGPISANVMVPAKIDIKTVGGVGINNFQVTGALTSTPNQTNPPYSEVEIVPTSTNVDILLYLSGVKSGQVLTLTVKTVNGEGVAHVSVAS